jgi:hypothetical protein
MIKKFFSLNKTSQRLVIMTIVLLLYGYFCRLFRLYFFWESKVVGWELLFITIIFLLRERIQFKKSIQKKTISEYIAIVLIIAFGFLGQIFFIIAESKTDAYKTAIEYLKTDKTVSDELGEPTSIFLVPVGSISTTTKSSGQSGHADLNFVVKGQKKLKDFEIRLIKDETSDWRIASIR